MRFMPHINSGFVPRLCRSATLGCQRRRIGAVVTMNQIDLAGRRAVVTGGGQGIGRAIAERLLASGASVSLWDRDERLVEAVAAELSKDGRVARHAVVDVSSQADVDAAANATIDAFGHIDILVANAGIAGPNALVWEYPIDAWQQVLDVNLTGVFLCCRSVVPHMIRQNYGRIVNVASIAGKEGNPTASAVQRVESRRHCADQITGQGAGGPRHRGELHHPRRGADANPRAVHSGAHRLHALEDPARPVRARRRDCRHGGLARLAGERVHDRRRVRPQWRPRDLLRSA